jgi:hypothetical protein
VIPYPERYLAVDEENGQEVEKGQTIHYCIDDAIKKVYAHYRETKGKMELTFFPEPEVGQEQTQ